MLPPRKAIIGPKEGWKEKTYYLVKTAFNASNPIHESIFYSGFLDDDNKPAGCSQVWNPSYDHPIPSDEIYYLEVIGELVCKEEPKPKESLNKWFFTKQWHQGDRNGRFFCPLIPL